jgi:hypothetical protein
MDAFGTANATDRINALAVHAGAKVKMLWILEVAHGMQTELLDANVVPRQEVYMGGVDFQARASHGGLPAVRPV